MFRNSDTDLDAFLESIHDPPHLQRKDVLYASRQVLGQDFLPWLFPGFCPKEQKELVSV